MTGGINDKRDMATHNMALLQAGLTQELQPLSLSITFGAVRQVVAFKPRLQQALKRYTQLEIPTVSCIFPPSFAPRHPDFRIALAPAHLHPFVFALPAHHPTLKAKPKACK